jgi:hypothetical protein
MRALLATGGERLEIDSDLGWVDDLIRETAGVQLAPPVQCRATVGVRVERDSRPFSVRGWEPVTRGAWRHGGEVVLENACTAGFDVHVATGPRAAEFTFRWRPPARDHLAALLLRARFALLARAVLVQYPAMWWAGGRGRAPLHASALTTGAATCLLAGPGGVGKSTLLSLELAKGGTATSDNLCVSDGTTAWGVVEPLRVEGGTGRRMPHGRRERALPGRVAALTPDRLIVVRRGQAEAPRVGRCDAATAERSLVTGTYMAGELRRFWAFAATLASATGAGPAHPPVAGVAAELSRRLDCIELTLPRHPGPSLGDALTLLEEHECR